MMDGDYSQQPKFSTQLASYEIRLRDEEGILFHFWLCLKAEEPMEAVLQAFRDISRHTAYRFVVPKQYQLLSIANTTSRTVLFGPF